MGDRKLRLNLGRSTSKTIPYISRYPVNQPGAVSVNTWDNHSSPLSSPPPRVTTLYCPIDSFRYQGDTKVLTLDTPPSLSFFKRKSTQASLGKIF